MEVMTRSPGVKQMIRKCTRRELNDTRRVGGLDLPVFVHTLAAHLRQIGGGRIPRYYQVLLKVRFQKEMPTEITYVLARELQ